MADNERAFNFLRMNRREQKRRHRGITEIRGPYYTPMGRRYAVGDLGHQEPVGPRPHL